MGYDVSNHAVDTKLMTERLIPALLGQASIDDIRDRAADLSVVHAPPISLAKRRTSRAFPAIEENFGTTIIMNHSLGGYVRPENVSTLRALLEKHERELIYAFVEPHEMARVDPERVTTDYKKILESVVFAERKGYGFIEAAEIYSGFLGVLN